MENATVTIKVMPARVIMVYTLTTPVLHALIAGYSYLIKKAIGANIAKMIKSTG